MNTWKYSDPYRIKVEKKEDKFVTYLISKYGERIPSPDVNYKEKHSLFNLKTDQTYFRILKSIGLFNFSLNYLDERDLIKKRINSEFSYLSHKERGSLVNHELYKKRLYDQIIPEIKNNYYPKIFIPNRIKTKVIKPNFIQSSETKGASEAFFYQELLKYFKDDEIFWGNFELKKTKSIFSYYPDFVYYNKQKELIIDIEIDEPYVYTSNKPTHYFGIDSKRDEHFIKSGWFVVRFTEKQICQQPSSCCRFLKFIIALVLDDIEELSSIMFIDDIKYDHGWSETEAVNMANKKYRDEYMSNCNTNKERNE